MSNVVDLHNHTENRSWRTCYPSCRLNQDISKDERLHSDRVLSLVLLQKVL
uniref:Uncharacterized protein n=1 Tax=Solanum tuberosum TaxID=4113 RepID=M1C2P0_SOLTU